MNPKNVAIWTLSAALIGATAEVPSIFLGRVIGDALLAAMVTLVMCAVVSAFRRRKTSRPAPQEFTPWVPPAPADEATRAARASQPAPWPPPPAP